MQQILRKGIVFVLILAICFAGIVVDCDTVNAQTARGKVKAIKYLQPSTVTFDENTDGYWSIGKNGKFYYRYIELRAEPKAFTAEYENGKMVTYSYASGKGDIFSSSAQYRGNDGSQVELYNPVRSNQHETPFTVGGNNYFTFNFEGASARIPVDIRRSQVAKTVESIQYLPKNEIVFDYSSAYTNGEKGVYWGVSPISNGDILKVAESGKTTEYTYNGDEEQFSSQDGKSISWDVLHLSHDQYSPDGQWGYGKACYFLVEYGGAVTKVPITIKQNDIKSISIYMGAGSNQPEFDCDELNKPIIDGIVVQKSDNTTETIKGLDIDGEQVYKDENGNDVRLEIQHQDLKSKGQWFVSYQGVTCRIQTNHMNITWEVVESPTCTKMGTYKGTCICGEVMGTKTIPVDSAAHNFTNYVYNNDGKVGVDGTETAVCNNGCGAKDTRKKSGTAAQKPIISAGNGYTTSISTDGTTVAIAVKDGYELVEVIVNGISKGKITSLSGLKTGDKVEVKVTKRKDTLTVKKVKAELAKITYKNFKSRPTQVKMKSGKKAIKTKWTNTKGVKFDGVEIFRSTKKNSGYGYKPYFTSKSGTFYNTSIKKGVRYYYKARGYIKVDGVKYYSNWSAKVWHTVK